MGTSAPVNRRSKMTLVCRIGLLCTADYLPDYAHFYRSPAISHRLAPPQVWKSNRNSAQLDMHYLLPNVCLILQVLVPFLISEARGKTLAFCAANATFTVSTAACTSTCTAPSNHFIHLLVLHVVPDHHFLNIVHSLVLQLTSMRFVVRSQGDTALESSLMFLWMSSSPIRSSNRSSHATFQRSSIHCQSSESLAFLFATSTIIWYVKGRDMMRRIMDVRCQNDQILLLFKLGFLLCINTWNWWCITLHNSYSRVNPNLRAIVDLQMIKR